MAETKTCPRCAEDMRAAASMCPHCRLDLKMWPGTPESVEAGKKIALVALAGVALVILILVAGWLKPAPSAAPATATAVESIPIAAPDARRYDPGKVAEAEAALRSEKWVKDLVFDDGGPVVWQIGIISRGGRETGYAEVACMILAERGVVDEETDVRIVDLADPAARQGDFRTGSRAHIRCHDNSDLGI